MKTARIAIVGGGLSGLYAAYLLEQKGIRDYVLLEARDLLGGRILSVPVSTHPVPGTAHPATNIDRFDLGPSWFWPDLQRRLDRLVHELGLECFAQFETGSMVVERSPHEPPIRTRGYVNSPPSMRLPGGSAALFGFFGLPARMRQRVPEAALRAHCRAQFTRLFGPQAATPKAELIKDWAREPYTATAADPDEAGQHAEAPAASTDAGPWSDRLTGIASEWSQHFPGYLAGAIDAADRAVQALPRVDMHEGAGGAFSR